MIIVITLEGWKGWMDVAGINFKDNKKPCLQMLLIHYLRVGGVWLIFRMASRNCLQWNCLTKCRCENLKMSQRPLLCIVSSHSLQTTSLKSFASRCLSINQPTNHCFISKCHRTLLMKCFWIQRDTESGSGFAHKLFSLSTDLLIDSIIINLILRRWNFPLKMSLSQDERAGT